MQMPNVTLAKDADLLPLLDLYRVAEVSLSAEPVDRAQQIWSEMLSNESIPVFVSNVDARIVALRRVVSWSQVLGCLNQFSEPFDVI
jgi:hypothetical protein